MFYKVVFSIILYNNFVFSSDLNEEKKTLTSDRLSLLKNHYSQNDVLEKIKIQREYLKKKINTKYEIFIKEIKKSIKKINLLSEDSEEDNYLSFAIETLTDKFFDQYNLEFEPENHSILEILLEDKSIVDRNKKIIFILDNFILYPSKEINSRLYFKYQQLLSIIFNSIIDNKLNTYLQLSIFKIINKKFEKLKNTGFKEQDTFFLIFSNFLQKKSKILFQKFLSLNNPIVINSLLMTLTNHGIDFINVSQTDPFSPNTIKIEFLEEITRRMCTVREKMNKYRFDNHKNELIVDNYLDEFIEHYLYNEPFQISNLRILDQNSHSIPRFVRRKGLDEIKKYIKLGIIRNEIILSINKNYIKPLLKSDEAYGKFYDFLQYINVSENFSHELFNYRGKELMFFNNNKDMANTIKLAITKKNKNILNLVLIIYKERTKQFKDHYDNNIFHLCLFSKEKEKENSSYQVLNTLLYSRKIHDLTKIRLLLQKNNKGQTPLDIAKENHFDQCKKEIEYFLLLNNSV